MAAGEHYRFWHCRKCLVEWCCPDWEAPLCWVCGRRGRAGWSPDRRALIAVLHIGG